MKSLTVLVVLVGVLISQIVTASVQDKKADIISNTKKTSSLDANDDKIDKLKALLLKLNEKKTTKAKRLLGEHECEDKCDGGHPECASWCHIKDAFDHDNKVGEQLKKKIEHDRASLKIASAEAKRKLKLKSLLEKLRQKIDDNSLDDQNSEDAESSDNEDDIGHDSQGCGEFPLQQCTSTLLESFSSGEALYHEIGESLLPEICSALEDANKCLQSEPACTSDDWLVELQWSGINDSLHYICTDGKDALAGYQTCLTTKGEDYYNEIFTCFETLPDLSDDDVPDPAIVCSYYNALLKCTADAAGDICDSAQFVATYFIDANQPALNLYDAECTLSYTGAKKSKKTLLLEKLEKLLSDMK